MAGFENQIKSLTSLSSASPIYCRDYNTGSVTMPHKSCAEFSVDKYGSFWYHNQGEFIYESVIILKKRADAHSVGFSGCRGSYHYAAVMGAVVGYRLAHARHAVYDADGARGLQKGKYLPSAAQAVGLSLFLVFSVFFSSMFVTNDVSLIIFVPLTIILFRAGGKERYILPVISMENIAAVRGSLLTPFGSPQNLFIYGQSGVSAWRFISYMFPIWVISGVLLVGFVALLYRKNIRQRTDIEDFQFIGEWQRWRRGRRIAYLVIFAIVITTIVTRTGWWFAVVPAVAATVFFIDRQVLALTDYVLLLTFFCFFIFSSSIARNEAISSFLSSAVANHEYLWSILLSQAISNVPAAIVLYPFAVNRGALLYGLDSAGLCTLIGSLASVINYRLYVREYPGKGKRFILIFTLISLAFFAIVAVPGYFISLSPL